MQICEAVSSYDLVALLTGDQFRLVSSNLSSEGWLEVLHEGQWGTVCSEGFDGKDARVACRSLGIR